MPSGFATPLPSRALAEARLRSSAHSPLTYVRHACRYGGIYRLRALWFDALIVTDPSAVAAICGRGDGALDKASVIYTPINQVRA